MKKKSNITRKLIRDIRKNTTLAVSAAFALVIALTWNDVIREGVTKLIENINLPFSGYVLQLIIAVLVTAICVMGIMFFSRWAEKE